MTVGTMLVTGAAGGQQGKTGRRVTELLRARGIPVRAMVRTLDQRADYLRGLGAEVVVGDFLDFGSIQDAVDGVSTVYFAYPVQEGLLDATVNMAVAARNAGVTRLVDMVMLVSTPDAPTPRLRENYLSEQVFEWAGIGAAHVRATVFSRTSVAWRTQPSHRACSWRPSVTTRPSSRSLPGRTSRGSPWVSSPPRRCPRAARSA